jgi:membrane protein implicated in regulation of membrane protease activity
MRHLRWLILFVAALAAICVWWANKDSTWAELVGIAVLLIVVPGLAYFLISTRGTTPSPRAEQERDTRDVERDIPPRST